MMKKGMVDRGEVESPTARALADKSREICTPSRNHTKLDHLSTNGVDVSISFPHLMHGIASSSRENGTSRVAREYGCRVHDHENQKLNHALFSPPRGRIFLFGGRDYLT